MISLDQTTKDIILKPIYAIHNVNDATDFLIKLLTKTVLGNTTEFPIPKRRQIKKP